MNKKNVIFVLSMCFFYITLGLGSKIYEDIMVLQKIFIVFFCICMFFVSGIVYKYYLCFCINTIVIISCYFLSDQFYNPITFFTLIKSILGSSIFYLILMINFKQSFEVVCKSYISFLPIMSIMSIILYVVIGYDIVSDTNYRFGAGIANAHFAFLIYYAIIIFLFKTIIEDKLNVYFFGVLILLLLASGSRGPLVAILLPTLLIIPKFKVKKVALKLIYLLPFLATGLFFAALNIINRSESIEFDSTSSISLSGRDFAWEYFLNQIVGLNLFGGGFGSLATLTEGIREYNLFLFVAPHNEFIRYYMETGIIGLILCFSILMFVFLDMYKTSEKKVKKFLILCFPGFLLLTFFDNTLSTIQSLVPLAIFIKYVNYRQAEVDNVT
jgi:teichuronic acid biosynthesis protein TuaE